jgi:hypothetical protein
LPTAFPQLNVETFSGTFEACAMKGNPHLSLGILADLLLLVIDWNNIQDAQNNPKKRRKIVGAVRSPGRASHSRLELR